MSKETIETVFKILEKILQLESMIEIQIKKEGDAKKRKRLRKAYQNRDSNYFRKLLFG